jgi:hypothetical protein
MGTVDVPIIPAMQKAEIRRIVVLAQHGQLKKVHETSILMEKAGHGGVHLSSCYAGEYKIELHSTTHLDK